MREVLLPDIGDFKDVEVIELLVNPGARIKEGDSILTLESDKASMEIPTPRGGVVRGGRIKVGDRINQGDLLLVLEADAAGGQAGAEPTPAERQQASAPAEEEPAELQPEQPERMPGEKIPAPPPVPMAEELVAGVKSHASPAIRRFARELGVDLSRVTGSGPKGRILKSDVQQFVKQQLGRPQAATVPSVGGAIPPIPEVDFSQFGEIEEVPLSRIQRISGPHLHRAWLNVPHVTQFDEADITELETFRKAEQERAGKLGIKLTFLPLLLKAVAEALKQHPQVNSSLSPAGDRFIHKRYVHIGVAVDTSNGLVVPVIRNVDRKGVLALAQELAEVSARAREGKLSPSDLQGGSFSISSLGGIGGTYFTPIINAPEAAILGVSRASMKPVWNGETFEPRLMLPLSLSYDHRVIDGAEGARFTTTLGRLLADLRRVLL